ncbi:MAG: hypothetical protein N2316_11185 [Spirochaetes bacterium]|nr:hypothetical protein [Spirochaetota bacterium]
MKRIVELFVEKSTPKETNVFITVGAVLLLLSLSFPYFRIAYSFSEHSISPLELMAKFFIFNIETSFLLIATLFYLGVIALLSFVIPKRISALLASFGMILLPFSLYFSYVPIERMGVGIVASFLGLALLLTGFIEKR